MPGQLLAERRGHVALLTLSNPAKRNALDPGLCGALASALAALAGDGVRAAVVTGEGDKAFSAGFDVDALGAAGGPLAAERSFEGLIDAVVASPVPLVAALNGVAFGGAFELAATCDLRVGHAGVKLGMPPARLGVVYAPRGLARFQALLGEARARELFLLARTLDAAEAAAWGLIDRLVAPGEVLPQALALADEMAALAPLAVQGIRRGFELLLERRAALEPPAAEEIARRRAESALSADGFEARRAFAEKRKPIFTGK